MSHILKRVGLKISENNKPISRVSLVDNIFTVWSYVNCCQFDLVVLHDQLEIRARNCAAFTDLYTIKTTTNRLDMR